MDKGLAKHERIIDELVDTLIHKYGHTSIERHKEYFDEQGTLLGEFDVLVTTPNSVRVYEIKGNPKSFRKGQEQLRRAQNNVDYWLDSQDLNTHYTIISQNRYYEWLVKRC